jgi:hypothetical protein
MIDYPWYAVVTGADLQQGDLLRNCPVLVPLSDFTWPLSGDLLPVEVQIFDVVILSQSCDLVNDKVEDVVICPHTDLPTLAQESDFFKSRQGREALRRGNVPGYHLLAAYEGEVGELRGDLRVVDFRRVYSLPKVFLRRFAEAQGPRLRLLPPYREHLAQAFARFFMRVGLLVDIPPFLLGSNTS